MAKRVIGTVMTASKTDVAAVAAEASTAAAVTEESTAAAVTQENIAAVVTGLDQTGINQTVASINDSVAGAVAGFENTQTKVQMSMDKAMKSAEELVSFGQANVEAVVKSGQIWAAGVQDLHKTMTATMQAQFETAMGSFKALSGVKSLKEAMDVQSALAKSSLEAAMAETGKITDASVKLAEHAMAPITARVTLAMEKFGRAA